MLAKSALLSAKDIFYPGHCGHGARETNRRRCQYSYMSQFIGRAPSLQCATRVTMHSALSPRANGDSQLHQCADFRVQRPSRLRRFAKCLYRLHNGRITLLEILIPGGQLCFRLCGRTFFHNATGPAWNLRLQDRIYGPGLLKSLGH
jgi:hypothetical protein